MPDAKPEQIIEAFDHCLVFVYGERFARENPHKSDIETATQWTNDGLDILTACFVFFKQMTMMHEKSLSWANHDDRSLIPHSLKVFSDNIDAAIRRVKSGGFEVDFLDRSDSLWRSRFKGWLKNPSYWQTEMWGAPPYEPGCRVPRYIIEEFKSAA